MANPTRPLMNFPEATAFFDTLDTIDNAFANQFDAFIASDTALLEQRQLLGTGLSLAYRLSCCHWGCHGREEHAIEYLVGRVVNHVCVAYRSLRTGHLDESLALVRNTAEAANLMNLFLFKPESRREWIDCPANEQWKYFKPVLVRKRLEEIDAPVPIDKDHYSNLCSVGTHVHSEMRPGMHNETGRPIVGASFQPIGIRQTLNEILWTFGTFLGPAAKVSVLDRKIAESIIETAIAIVETVPVSTEETADM